MIVCCGEALVDFLPAVTPSGEPAFLPVNGGSIYNVTIALARLGLPVGFFGGLSEDFFGRQLKESLRDSGVDLNFAVTTSRPSTLAFVRFQQGEAEYAFVDEGSAGRLLTSSDLPELPGKVSALHFGSISLVHEPAGATLTAFLRQEAPRRVISLDPNIRPGQIQNREAYLTRLTDLVDRSDIVKLSDADLSWIAPDCQVSEIADQWLAKGAGLVVLTKGAAGVEAFSRKDHISLPAHPVNAIDTIGAGDTFMASFLASLYKQDLLEKDATRNLDASALQTALDFASRAAAICVTRQGANPPFASELEPGWLDK